MPICFKKTTVFFVFFNKDYKFYTKNLSIRPKNCIQSIFYNETCKEFRKNQFFSNIFTFLIVIYQNFENNLRILAILGNLHVKTQKSTDFTHTFSKNYIFFVYFNEDYTFYTKNLFIRPKNCVQSFFYNERCKEFRKNHFLVTFLHF